jgi:hypothetical protein
MIIKKTLILLLLFIGLMNVIVCSTLKRNNKVAAPVAEPEVTVSAQYQKYQTAMGKGKGMVFQINIISKQELKVDSVVIGGKSMVFNALVGKPSSYEVNYAINKPEPSAEQPNPRLVQDPIIDEKQFQPAWVSIQIEGKSHRIPLLIFSEMPR